MTVIRVRSVYLHQGHTLHPKLAYAVPPDVASGLCGLELADACNEPADLTIDAISWPEGVTLAAEVRPDSLEHPQDDVG